MKIGIAGAGLLGRLAAWHLAHAGHRVSVYDPAAGPDPTFDGQGAAGFTAAGMLSPLAELDCTDSDVAALGWRSIERWAQISARLAQLDPQRQPHFDRQGSLLVAHGSDVGAARRVLARIEAGARHWPSRPQALTAAALAELEPSLHGSQGPLQAWLLPGEGAVCTVGTLQALQVTAPGVQWHWRCRVDEIEVIAGGAAGRLRGARASGTGDGAADERFDAAFDQSFDCVLDLRGTGARPACDVRGVRGEVIWLHAPGVPLHRPVRLLHPRYRVYMVPRPGDLVVVGASEIESEDRSPVSLRTAVELMAAAHSVVPGLAEARILKLDRNLRPALPDNRPQVHVEPGLVRVNGLYRHGWLLAPALLDDALERAGLIVPGQAPAQRAPLAA